jgi:pimeloyl-ACP methyl ester carboxylesterase
MIKDRFVQTRHGRIHALETGSGSPLILLHTLGGSAYQFKDTLPLLAQRHHVLAVDLVGHGDSDPMLRYLSIEEHSEILVDIADQLGAPINIFGQSVGGYIAAAAAANLGGRIAKSLIGEAPPRVEADYASGWPTFEVIWTTVNNTAEEVSPRLRKMTPEVLTRWNVDRNKAGAKTMMLTYLAIRDFDLIDAVRRIGVSAMIVAGEKSVGQQLDKLKAYGMDRLPIKVMKDCGHFLSLDDSNELAKIINDFMTP